MKSRYAVLRMTLAIVCVSVAIADLELAPDRDYPNELPGYQFHARARWRAILPLVSRDPEVVAQLGPLKPAGYTFEHRWRLFITYWGEGGDCAGKPFPSFLVGTVAEIQLIPKERVSFSNVEFPDSFTRSLMSASHDRVGLYQRYKDEHGLAYEVYDKASEDGTVHAGDLRSIVYGPSDHVYATLTGCDP